MLSWYLDVGKLRLQLVYIYQLWTGSPSGNFLAQKPIYQQSQEPVFVQSHETFSPTWAYEETFAEKGTLEKSSKKFLTENWVMFLMGEDPQCLGFGRTLGWPNYTWDKIFLGCGREKFWGIEM